MGVNKLSKVHFLFTFLTLQVGEKTQKSGVFSPRVGEIIHLPFSTRKKDLVNLLHMSVKNGQLKKRASYGRIDIDLKLP